MISAEQQSQKQMLMARAIQQCAQRDLQFTPQRQQLFMLLYDMGRPVTAYELLDEFKLKCKPRAQPMTVYRTLEFLFEAGLVHRIDSKNQYLVCRHLTCHHEHGVAQFLICDRCGAVTELSVSTEQWRLLQDAAAMVEFKLAAHPLELHGVCKSCQAEH